MTRLDELKDDLDLIWTAFSTWAGRFWGRWKDFVLLFFALLFLYVCGTVLGTVQHDRQKLELVRLCVDAYPDRTMEQCQFIVETRMGP